MGKSVKTNAMRLLDASRIPYEAIEYPVDEERLEATHVAEVLGEDPGTVYKTIVMKGKSSGPVIFVVSADREVDLKLAAKAVGDKKVEPLPLRELEPLTGYIRGGCTAIGIRCPNAPVIVSREFITRPYIFVSGGRRGIQLKMKPADYIRITHATPGDIVAAEEETDEG